MRSGATPGLTSLRGKSPDGQTPQEGFQLLDAGKVNQDFVVAVRFMKTHTLTNGRPRFGAKSRKTNRSYA